MRLLIIILEITNHINLSPKSRLIIRLCTAAICAWDFFLNGIALGKKTTKKTKNRLGHVDHWYTGVGIPLILPLLVQRRSYRAAWNLEGQDIPQSHLY